MENRQTPSPEIAGVIETLPQADGEAQRKRTYTKRRKRKTAQRSAAAREAVNLNIPSSDEEPRSKVFLTTVANLALLIAVLTIVFAAHRAVQNRQQEIAEKTIDHTQTIDQAAQTTDQPQKVQAAEPAEPTEPAETVEPVEPAKAIKTVKRYSDPYTNGGPLDLDRHGNAGADIAGDLKNPWNSGGPLDLDNEAARQQYKKALSLAE
jgi:hypothetical protein